MSKPFVLELSISDATDENKTLSENLAHRESTNAHQYDPDASIYDQDDNALDSDSDDQVTVEKKGRGKDNEAEAPKKNQQQRGKLEKRSLSQNMTYLKIYHVLLQVYIKLIY